MNTQVICTLIALLGTVSAGIISWFVSKLSAEKEIQKMRLSWEHDNALTSDDDFSEMAAAVATCLQSQIPASFDSAIACVAALRIKETGTISLKLDALYDTLYQISPNSGTVDFAAFTDDYKLHLNRANDCLTDVIKEKRKAKGAHH